MVSQIATLFSMIPRLVWLGWCVFLPSPLAHAFSHALDSVSSAGWSYGEYASLLGYFSAAPRGMIVLTRNNWSLFQLGSLTFEHRWSLIIVICSCNSAVLTLIVIFASKVVSKWDYQQNSNASFLLSTGWYLLPCSSFFTSLFFSSWDSWMIVGFRMGRKGEPICLGNWSIGTVSGLHWIIVVWACRAKWCCR